MSYFGVVIGEHLLPDGDVIDFGQPFDISSACHENTLYSVCKLSKHVEQLHMRNEKKAMKFSCYSYVIGIDSIL